MTSDEIINLIDKSNLSAKELDRIVRFATMCFKVKMVEEMKKKEVGNEQEKV